MKKILLSFAFLPMLSFAQDVNESPRKEIFDSSVIKESNDPAVFLDGERVDKSIFTKMNSDDIKYITVIKTDKKYPNGKIDIVSKKEKES
ncbi:hypothetical protein HXZ94_06960 [Empedobacter falsenii]|uniref:hypothetical protein n=1 Tax=Empedobacter falsenii TaxID=343874 RepID=UPI0025759E51|nr:hypothetical protein [Empedobacter falsenii]MDM1298239.1 hypothetical protein [Empedobacter falsenii]MDM1318204.1 hypothetical protein [Empedobacter falsenii]